jgi:tetratricopeptide (TPR) repeat protein
MVPRRASRINDHAPSRGYDPEVERDTHSGVVFVTEEEIAKLWDFNDPAASERRFREALVAVSGDREAHAELQTQLARSLGLQGRFDDAHALLDEVDAIGGIEPRVKVRAALERGRLCNSAGNSSDAIPYFSEALELAESAGESSLAIDAAHMLAIASPPVEQLAWNLRALAMAEAATDDASRGWAGALLNNIGWTYHDRGDYELALDHFTRAAAFRRAKEQARETRIADWCVGRTLRSLGRIEEALAMQFRLAEEWSAAGESDPYVSEELGECLLAAGRAGEAREHFAEAAKGLADDPWLVNNEPARIERLKLFATEPESRN